MTAPRTSGARLKIQRATRHMEELRALVEAWKRSSPYDFLHEDDLATGDRVYRVALKHPPPAVWTAVVGDAIHNLRSALDHLIWQAVLANGATPDKHTGFPVTTGPGEWPGLAAKRLKGASVRTSKLIRRLRPYKGGNNALWHLHLLDIEDKHKTLLILGGVQRSIGLGVAIAPPQGAQALPSPMIHLAPADPPFPTADGDEVLRIANFREHGGLFERVRFDFTVAFGATDGSGPVHLVPTLKAIGTQVIRITDLFERFIL